MFSVVYKHGEKTPQGRYFFDVHGNGRPLKGFLTVRDMGVLRRCVELAGADAVIVEVGSWVGRSTIAMADMLKELGRKGMVYAVDPHRGYRGPKDPLAPPTLDMFSDNVRRYGVGDFITPIVSATKDVAWDVPVDMVFIDGLHDYGNVKIDFDKFDPYLKPGGLVAFHDYGRAALPGVKDFVDTEVLSRGDYGTVCAYPWMLVAQKKGA